MRRPFSYKRFSRLSGNELMFALNDLLRLLPASVVLESRDSIVALVDSIAAERKQDEALSQGYGINRGTPLDDFALAGMSTRLYNVLKDNGVRTFGQFVDLSDEGLIRMRRAGIALTDEASRLRQMILEKNPL